MRASLAVGAAFAASFSGVSAQACASGTANNILGNWYCQAVDSISYTNFGSSGTYNQITDMTDGNCQSEPKEFSGPLAPLNDEVSWHFRGPLHLKQFAYYIPGTGLGDSKRDAKPTPHERRHGHGHLHSNKAVRDIKRQAAMDQKRGVGDLVTTVINGKKVSWINTWDGTSDTSDDSSSDDSSNDAPAAPAPAPAPDSGDDSTPTQNSGNSGNSGSTDGGAPPVNAGWGRWGRQAYYNAESGIADGLAFMNHNGGDKSGVFDYNLGSSLSYASEDGLSGAASPQCLKDQVIGDNNEIVIMSDKECNGNCGTVRPGTVAHHGFGGDSKLFLMEFSMPMTGKTGWNEDMPAAWMLNAQIPRTLQYGKADCSCWESGCGEWDIFEVLDSGNTRCKSTLHGTVSGGDSNYFKRPSDGTVKVAVLYDGMSSSGHIKVLDDDTDFGETLSGIEVTAFTIQSVLSSIFSLGS